MAHADGLHGSSTRQDAVLPTRAAMEDSQQTTTILIVEDEPA
jgi:hypothetical protein